MYRLFCVLGLAISLAACGRSSAQPAAGAEAASVGASFLANNAKLPGVMKTPSGLQYKITKSGPADGAHPGPTDEVKVNYEGKLINGQVFDSSYQRGEPADLPMNRIIPGWTEALQLMRPGDEWTLYIPANLAYGDNSPDPNTIPQNSVLIFRIELLGVLQHPVGGLG